jgi:predicted Zn-dependent protease with MMP-like domain/predicted Zn-dependent protease
MVDGPPICILRADMGKGKQTDGPKASMDALTAHLDRGWDLLKKNDLRGAEHSAQKALETEPDSPEALTLLGAIAAADGDEEEALEQYRRAMEADPEYVSPMLYAAELLLGPEGDPDEALRLVDDALELAEEEEDYLDALLLKAEALIAFGDADAEAREVLAELPPVRLPDPVFHLRAGRCFLDLGDVADAEKHYRQVVDDDAADADGWYGLGLVCEERGDEAGKIAAWKRVRALDLEQPPPPWAISEDEFEKIAESVLAELPPRIHKLLENVPLIASDYPSEEVVADGFDPRALGYFAGKAMPEKRSIGEGESGDLNCIYLFQRNIERMCRDRDEVHEEVRITVLHETGHFFGLSEDDMERLGLD